MAQTRACAKALRNVLAWVVVLAGNAPTPSEEMTHVERIPTKAEKTVGQLENELKEAMESECFNAEQRKKVAGWLKKKPGYDKIKEQLGKCLEQVKAWEKAQAKKTDLNITESDAFDSENPPMPLHSGPPKHEDYSQPERD